MIRARVPRAVGFLLAMIACAVLGAFLSQGWHTHTAPAQGAPAPERDAKPSPPESWLKGTTDEKFAQIERHLRGLDVTMSEIGYRYGELLLAAKTRNWEYAQYQTEKIDLSLRLALERRPKRANSSQPLLKEDLPRVLDAIKKREGEQLDKAMVRLHDSCVLCHKNEKVLHFKESVERIRDRAMK